MEAETSLHSRLHVAILPKISSTLQQQLPHDSINWLRKRTVIQPIQILITPYEKKIQTENTNKIIQRERRNYKEISGNIKKIKPRKIVGERLKSCKKIVENVRDSYQATRRTKKKFFGKGEGKTICEGILQQQAINRITLQKTRSP
jgi:hypothetical protein